jgi:Ferritin-like domain
MTVNERTPDDQASRRWLITAGVAGAAASLVRARSAAATTPPSPPAPEQTEPPPTAASVPAEPTEGDVELLRFLQSAELAAHDLYQAAVDAGADSEVFATFADNHQAYADLLSGLLGGPERPLDSLYSEHQDAFESSDVAAVAEGAYDLESTLVATHADVIGQLEGTDGATALASVLVVEARMCAVLADLAGQGDDLDALLENDADALSQAGS